MLRPVIWLLQSDFRLRDNPALAHAAAQGPVIPLYMHSTTGRPLGGAAAWARHHGLTALAARVPLVVRVGNPLTLLPQLVQEWGAAAVCCNAAGNPEDPSFYTALQAAVPSLSVFWAGNLLHTPATFRTGQGGYYKVFTPFFNALSRTGWPSPLPAVTGPWQAVPNPGSVASLGLLPTCPNWAKGWESLWPSLVQGEVGALSQLSVFLTTGLPSYATGRDVPSLSVTSGLSVALQEGHLSPRTVAQALETAALTNPVLAANSTKFLAELGWREFARHLLWHFPQLPTDNWKPAFNAYPWRNPNSAEGQRLLHAWQTGQTGYPLVDAGMRQLWQTGTMHNRVRMVAASFLTKHLRLPWQVGEDWFWSTLLDASPASHALNWQWVAGSGPDAAPYFRIFNPTEQARKFDPANTYIRTWCPEVGTPAYPLPIVNHAHARQEALTGYKNIKNIPS